MTKLLERINLLEKLIKKYADHVASCEGVSFLEDRYSGSCGGADDAVFTDEEWDELRRIAGEEE